MILYILLLILYGILIPGFCIYIIYLIIVYLLWSICILPGKRRRQHTVLKTPKVSDKIRVSNSQKAYNNNR